MAVNEVLLRAKSAEVDLLVLEGEKTVNLRKDGEQWKLGNGLPVDGSRVESLLATLTSLKSSWPVANTAAAAERFSVGDEGFKLKVSLFHGDSDLGQLIVGTSPGFNQSHIRLPKEQAIYALPFSIFDAPTDQSSWLDSTLLQPAGDLLSLSSGDFSITKVDGHWPAPTDKADSIVPNESDNAEPASAFDVESFSRALTELRVTGVAEDIADLDAIEKEGAAMDEKRLHLIKWSAKTSEATYEYQILGKGEQYYIRRSDLDHTFRISKTQYESFAKIKENSAIAGR
jgi:hypothetical protein